MSRAFVKESDGDEVYDDLPDRPVDPHPNLVTARGLALIDGEIARLQAALSDAQAKAERAAIAEASRDLRYWQARHATAEVAPPAVDHEQARFGLRVTLERGDGTRQSFHIVGVDESDPAKGRLSYVAPLAQALLGKRVGDTASFGKDGEAEIVAIEAAPATD
ncbi:MAG TPA: transcription elongation factor GreA [Alphaproteobacteria bacterium]|jgi:transcription elongation GreA/GreB family factor